MSLCRQEKKTWQRDRQPYKESFALSGKNCYAIRGFSIGQLVITMRVRILNEDDEDNGDDGDGDGDGGDGVVTV